MKTVGRYEILREVGRGGMAMVYLARQTDLDRFVALKELGAFHASDPSFAQRFLRESRVAGSLSHPNIVTVHDYFEHDGTPYIAMEYVDRGSLRPHVGRMTMAQISGVLEGLLAGLTNAEQHGIVHRDLKPENLMVTSDGRVKIADFGIAKATTKMQTGAFLTATGTTVGTPTYMAPEQAMAQEIGPWTDLYSVGCMAFEMFTGRVPFHDSDAPMAILLRHVNEPIPPVKSIEPSVDQGVSDWIEALLVKDPGQRTQSAGEAWDEFEEIVISRLGPRWRREARLVERAEQPEGNKPLTPAPFQGAPEGGAESSGEFQSFSWGRGDTGGAVATPGPYTPPPQDLPPGPMQPPPEEAAPEPVAEPQPEPVAEAPVAEPPAPLEDDTIDSGFVTFGAPAPAPPTDALVPPPAPAPAFEEPVAEPESAAEAPAPPAPEPPAPPEAGSREPAAPPEPPAPPEAWSPEPTAEVASPPPPPAPTPPAEVPAAPEPVAEAPTSPAPEPVAEAPAPPAPEPAFEDFETFVPQEPSRPPEVEPGTDALEPLLPSEPEPADARVAPPEPVTPPTAVPVEDAGAETLMPSALRDRPERETKPPKPPKPPRERKPKPAREPGGGSRALPIVIGLGVVALILGFLLGGSGGGDKGSTPPKASGPALPVSGGTGDLDFKAPKGYAPISSVPKLAGLVLSDASAVGPGGKDDGAFVVSGFGKDAKNPYLLPTGLLKSLGASPPKPDAVELAGGLQAYRYANLKPNGSDRAMTVYAAPSSKGVATLACVAPGDSVSDQLAATCDQMANTLTSAGDAVPLGPSESYAKKVSGALGTLAKADAAGRSRLAGAKTPSVQAAATRQLATAYGNAAKALGKADVGPADSSLNRELVSSLKATASAYRDAASAASRNDKGGFRSAGGKVSSARADVARAVAGLKAAGYEVKRS